MSAHVSHICTRRRHGFISIIHPEDHRAECQGCGWVGAWYGAKRQAVAEARLHHAAATQQQVTVTIPLSPNGNVVRR